MTEMNEYKTNELSTIIFEFLKQLDPAEFDDEEGNGGHTRASAIAECLAKHLVGIGLSIDAA